LDKNRLDEEQKVNDLSYNHKKELIKILNKIFDLKILDFLTKYHGENGMISIATELNENYVPITQFGDGFNKIFRYIVEIIYVRENKDNRIMIDEIDTGIHYTKHQDFWSNILTVCKEMGVQLFATTHSKEFAQAYVEAAKILDISIQKELRLIELYHSKDKVFSGTIKDIENIDYSVQNLPFRGENIYD
jgi:AAA15 family ATPase/GTPase